MLVDFHYHLADSPGALDELLKDMDASGVEWTLLMSGPTGGWWDFKKCGFAPNEAVAKAVKAHSDRLIGNVYSDPQEKDALGTLKKYLDAGFRAVKMWPPAGYFPDDDRCMPLYEEIEKRGMPLLVHTGQTNIQIRGGDPSKRLATDSRFAHPFHLDKLSRQFPTVPFVMAHSGYPHYLEAWSMAHANQNVYLDISGSGPWTDGIPLFYNAIGGQNFIPIDFERVVWGSDNCMPQAEHMAQMSNAVRQMGAKKKDRANVFGDNAKRLLKIG